MGLEGRTNEFFLKEGYSSNISGEAQNLVDVFGHIHIQHIIEEMGGATKQDLYSDYSIRDKNPNYITTVVEEAFRALKAMQFIEEKSARYKPTVKPFLL